MKPKLRQMIHSFVFLWESHTKHWQNGMPATQYPVKVSPWLPVLRTLPWWCWEGGTIFPLPGPCLSPIQQWPGDKPKKFRTYSTIQEATAHHTRHSTQSCVCVDILFQLWMYFCYICRLGWGSGQLLVCLCASGQGVEWRLGNRKHISLIPDLQ